VGEQQVTDDMKLRNRWEIAFTSREADGRKLKEQQWGRREKDVGQMGGFGGKHGTDDR
jgi:hypothetical protein